MNDVTIKQKESLIWITSLLHELGIPFQVSGGLAAKCYGSERPLNDIDIDVPESRLGEIAVYVKEWITFGPGRYQNGKWDLLLLSFLRNGQTFDIGGAESTKIFDDTLGAWKPFPAFLEKSVPISFEGVLLPVIRAEELVAYKTLLGGEHQRKDIAATKAYLGRA